MNDIFDKAVNSMGPIGIHMQKSHGYFTFPKLEGPLGPEMIFMGKKIINWSLNNYLGLVSHPDIIAADAKAAAQYGMGYPMGARMLTGNTNAHEKLEKQLSELVGREDTMLLNFGYQGVSSCIDALLSRHDVAVYDSLCHACIIDGLRMHLGKKISFQHNNIEDFETKIKKALEHTAQTKGGVLVITEGVFGMNGHQGILKEITALKKKYPFRLFIDDAHGFGYMGKTGAGTDEEQLCQAEVDVYFSTFVKSMGSIGAFISSKKEVIAYLRYNTRSQIYAKSLPMIVVEGMLVRLEMIKKNPQLKKQLLHIAQLLQNGLREKGFDIGTTNTPVTPIYLKGGLNEATNMAVDLREHYHLFCSIVVPPVIAPGNLIYRIIPTAVHTEEHVNKTLNAFSASREKLIKGAYQKEFPDMGIAFR